MIARLGLLISRIFRRTCPDPFLLAIGLTLLTALLVILLTTRVTDDGTVVHNNAFDAITYWQGGFWDLLAFSMQMCLILVTGHALASSPPIRNVINGIAQLPKGMTSATLLVAAVAMGLALINWGLGLIAGALIARDVARSLQKRNIPHHYPLLAASGYLGLLVWHGGLSGSAPLKTTQPDQVAEIFKGVSINFESIPLTESIFSPMNFAITGGVIIIALVVMSLMVPRDPEQMEPCTNFNIPDDEPPAREEVRTIPEWLENTPFFTLLLAVPIAVYLFDALITQGKWSSISPNEVNLGFLMLGMILHGTPRRYIHAVQQGVRGCSGIILLFPLYAGIMGMMKGSGLTAQMASTIADLSTDTTLPPMTMFSAGVVNLFIPTGGGQWAVQGPIAMEAAAELGISNAKMLMAVSYGDQLTNMLQPFWALPLLGITGVKARDIVGYTAIVMVLAFLWIATGLMIF